MTDGQATPGSPAARGKVPALRGLTAKQAVITLVIAMLVGISGSVVELYIDLRGTRADIAASTAQTLDLIRPSAAEAAYQLNNDLAGRVVAGLMRNPTVTGVVLRDDFGGVLAQQTRDAATAEGPFATRLFGDLTEHRLPLEHGGKAVGRLDLTLSAGLLSRRFFDSAAIVGVTGILRAIAICATIVVVFYGMITRPLVRLSQQVSAIEPAHPGRTLLPPAVGHARDEVGVLVSSLNGLLAAFQRGLEQRDTAQRELTALTVELEHRVEQRTRALAAAKEEIEQLNRRLRAENVRMGAELDVSRRLQRMILPTPDELVAIPGCDIATYMEPANEVGGDYYDILQDDTGRLRIGIGDVTGHGLESGVVMLMTQSAVRTLATGDETTMTRALTVLNRTIHDNVKRMGSDKSLTLALLDLRRGEDGTGHVRISGQHESVIVVRDGGRIELIDTTLLGLPIGLIDPVEPYLGETEVTLRPGDGVVLYTDGITEAADSNDRLYGLDRLCAVVSRSWSLPAEDIKRAVVEDVMSHIGTQTIYDDLTLIILKQKESA